MLTGAEDVILLATKTHNAEEALANARRAATPMGADPKIFCLQNGVGAEAYALRPFPDVYGVCVQLPSVFVEPGKVSWWTTPVVGLLDLGRYPKGVDATAEQVALDVTAAGFYSAVLNDVMPWKYSKLLVSIGNGLGAVLGVGGRDTKPGPQSTGGRDRLLPRRGDPVDRRNRV